MTKAGKTYYASPPQNPSTLTSRKTKRKLEPSDSALKSPKALSYTSANNMSSCTIAGTERNRVGRAGRPREMVDLEKKTVVWYTSFGDVSPK